MRFIYVVLMLFFNIPLCMAFADVLEFSGVLPNISLALTVLFPFCEGDFFKGFFIGLIGGFFQGVLWGEDFLIFAFLFGAIGFLSGYAGKLLKRKTLRTPILFTFGFSLMIGIIYLIFKNAESGELSVKGYILFKALPHSLYTAICSFPLYFLIKKLPKGFSHIKRKREAFYKK